MNQMLYRPGFLPPTQSLKTPYLGKLAICLPVVWRHCDDEDIPFNEHMPVLLAHGICHLLGYDHELDRDYLIMQKEETRILEEHLKYLS